VAKAAQAARSGEGGLQINMKKYGVYGTDYGDECQHVLQQRLAFQYTVIFAICRLAVFLQCSL